MLFSAVLKIQNGDFSELTSCLIATHKIWLNFVAKDSPFLISTFDLVLDSMGSLFSKKKEPERPRITEQDKAVLV